MDYKIIGHFLYFLNMKNKLMIDKNFNNMKNHDIKMI